MPKASLQCTSPNGWTDDFLCLEWFEKVFIPKSAEHNITGKPICLVFDGHGSHTAFRMIELARENGVHLYVLPPHTTHYLQPLNVNVFGPLQTAWAARCDDLIMLEMEQGFPNPKGMRREILIPEYLNVQEQTMTKENIMKAWEKCGLCPLKADIFSESDFGPSQSSSTLASFPTSFPICTQCTIGLCDDEHSDDGDSSDSSSSSNSSSDSSSEDGEDSADVHQLEQHQRPDSDMRGTGQPSALSNIPDLEQNLDIPPARYIGPAQATEEPAIVVSNKL